MRMKLNPLALMFLALPVALSACSLPDLPFVSDRVADAGQAQRGDLTIRLSGLSIQSFAEIAYLDLAIRVPKADYAFTKRVLASELKQATELTLKALPVGQGEIEAKAFKADASIIKSKRSPIRIDPGKTTMAQFEFYLGGDAATDLLLEFEAEYPRRISEFGPYDPEFNGYPDISDSALNLVWNYELTRSNQASQTITYRRQGHYYYLERALNSRFYASMNTPPEYFFLYVPKHAEYRGVTELPNYPKVRHLSFDNVFKVGGEERLLTVDRYYAPRYGLVKEVITGNGTVLSELTLLSYSASPAVPNGPQL